MAQAKKKLFNYDAIKVPEETGSYEYVLTQEKFDQFRKSVDDPEAAFPTLAIKHDVIGIHMMYDDPTGSVNQGNEVEFHNEPIPGKKVKVTTRFKDKYERNGKPYIVTEGTAVDEDGRLLEVVRTYQLKRPTDVGKKWANPEQK
jgi:hypothetical protein